jgi:hypothetical protein
MKYCKIRAEETLPVLVAVRGDLDQAHVTLIYLVMVLGGSASGGRDDGVRTLPGAFHTRDRGPGQRSTAALPASLAPYVAMSSWTTSRDERKPAL